MAAIAVMLVIAAVVGESPPSVCTGTWRAGGRPTAAQWGSPSTWRTAPNAMVSREMP
jgi:hypothetical protein